MPSQAITDLHLEDLPNIKPLELTLKRIGIESVLELATSIPKISLMKQVTKLNRCLYS